MTYRMPKKGQGNRGGGGSSKKPVPSPATNTDDNFITFTNSKGKDKVGNNSGTNTPKNRDIGSGSKGTQGLNGPALAGEAPKRPDTRTLIGGASWTGKLPVSMLSEHCQKQRWDNPEYTMVWRQCSGSL